MADNLILAGDVGGTKILLALYEPTPGLPRKITDFATAAGSPRWEPLSCWR